MENLVGIILLIILILPGLIIVSINQARLRAKARKLQEIIFETKESLVEELKEKESK